MSVFFVVQRKNFRNVWIFIGTGRSFGDAIFRMGKFWKLWRGRWTQQNRSSKFNCSKIEVRFKFQFNCLIFNLLHQNISKFLIKSTSKFINRRFWLWLLDDMGSLRLIAIYEVWLRLYGEKWLRLLMDDEIEVIAFDVGWMETRAPIPHEILN